MTCPECGRDDAVVTRTIHYPRGAITHILDCPHCVRLVLADAHTVTVPSTAPIHQ